MGELLSTDPPQPAELKELREAIDRVCADAARAELWATALSAFAQPAPQYDRTLVPVEKWPLGHHP